MSKNWIRFIKKWWKLIGGMGTVVALILVVVIVYMNFKPLDLQEQLDLGQRYLEEMNYEEAIVAFNTAIEIDPMNEEAYLGLVESYIRTGEFDAALEYAKKGFELTGNKQLKEKIDMIESGNITASNGWTMKRSLFDGDSNLISYITYTYDIQGREATCSAYNGEGALVDEEKSLYDGAGNQIVRPAITNYSEYRLGRDEITYNSNGDVISVKHYDENGALYNCDEYEYNTEGKISSKKCYDEFGVLLHYEEYGYDSKGNEINRIYDDAGNLNVYEEYDSKGNLIIGKTYDRDGNLIQYTESEFDFEGNWIGTKYFDGSGNMYQYYEYELDSTGNWTGIKYYDGDGNLLKEEKFG